jgi:hypothetical protein
MILLRNRDFLYYPQPPVIYDLETTAEYMTGLNNVVRKPYIYANFNPRYAQYATTILRTYYNFCCTYEVEKRIQETPAQRIGLTNKVFDTKDIIYFE